MASPETVINGIKNFLHKKGKVVDKDSKDSKGNKDSAVSCYPQDILSANSEVTKAIKISAYKYNYVTPKTDNFDSIRNNYIGNHQWSCYLPVPKLSTSDSHGYEPFDGFGLGQSLNDAARAWHDVKEGKLKAAGGESVNALTNLGIRGVYNILKNVMGDELSVVRRNFFNGASINPMTSKIYSSSSLKTYTFDFDMIARNEEESKIIHQIVSNFMRYGRPSSASKEFTDNTNKKITDSKIIENTSAAITFEYFEHPSVWKIEFIDDEADNKIANWLPKIKTCVLSGFDVSYGGEGTPLFFRGSSAPVGYSIRMTFEELFMQTSADV